MPQDSELCSGERQTKSDLTMLFWRTLWAVNSQMASSFFSTLTTLTYSWHAHAHANKWVALRRWLFLLVLLKDEPTVMSWLQKTLTSVQDEETVKTSKYWQCYPVLSKTEKHHMAMTCSVNICWYEQIIYKLNSSSVRYLLCKLLYELLINFTGLQKASCPDWGLNSREVTQACSAASWGKNRSFHARAAAIHWSCHHEIRCHRV